MIHKIGEFVNYKNLQFAYLQQLPQSISPAAAVSAQTVLSIIIAFEPFQSFHYLVVLTNHVSQAEYKEHCYQSKHQTGYNYAKRYDDCRMVFGIKEIPHKKRYSQYSERNHKGYGFNNVSEMLKYSAAVKFGGLLNLSYCLL